MYKYQLQALPKAFARFQQYPVGVEQTTEGSSSRCANEVVTGVSAYLNWCCPAYRVFYFRRALDNNLVFFSIFFFFCCFLLYVFPFRCCSVCLVTRKDKFSTQSWRIAQASSSSSPHSTIANNSQKISDLIKLFIQEFQIQSTQKKNAKRFQASSLKRI